MLVISYGIPKSGSTLAYEILRGILVGAGHPQDVVYNDRLESAEPKRGAKRNFLTRITKERLEDVMSQVPQGRIVAVKTHSAFQPDMFRWLEAQQQERAIQVIASYRDPRDICLSLVDAGERLRQRGQEKSFARVTDLEVATGNVERRLVGFRRWAALKGTLRLNYDTVAFEPLKAIEAIDRALGVESDHDRVMRYAFEEAFTLKNKAKRNRYEDELDDAQKKEMRKTFRKFIKRVMENDDQSWFDEYRETMLAVT